MFRDDVARLIVFRVGDEHFSLAIAAVDEVVDAPTIQPVPDAAPGMLGVAAVRGDMVPVYDPGALLNVDGLVPDTLLLFRRETRRVALAVNDVYDAISVHTSDVRPLPVGAGQGAPLAGIVRRRDELIALLDADTLLARLYAARPEGE